LPGKNYYRLRQVDFDGKITYSNVISVRFDESGSLVLYPVPAFDQLKVTLEKASLEDGNWQILDQNSRVVGSGVLPAETINIDINTSSLPEGFYIFRLSLGYNVLTRKFQKRQ
jgi:trimeric autotransporter adhesin